MILFAAATWAGTLQVSTPTFATWEVSNVGGDPATWQAVAARKLGEQFQVTTTGDWQLGVTVRSVRARYDDPPAVELEVEWELRGGDGVVAYQVATRGLAIRADGSARKLGQVAFEDAIARLEERPRFAEVVASAAPAPAAAADARFTIRRCEDATRKLPAEIFNLFDAVVVVKTKTGVGTAVVVSPDGFLLTAAHVVPDGERVDVQTHGGTVVPAVVVKRDTAQDVALLHADGLPAVCLPAPANQLGVGQDLFVIGTPGGLDYSVSKGVVSGLRMLDGHAYLQTDASISPGNSGGPMIDADGRLQAIVSFKIRAAGFEGLGFGVPTGVVVDRLGLTLGDHSDVAPTVAALDPRVVDPPDAARFDYEVERWRLAHKRQKQRTSGIVLASVGVAVGGGTAITAALLDHASDPGWYGLGALNTAGWLMAGGGAALIGVSFLPVKDGAGVAVSAEF